MKRETLFLKLALVLMALPILALCIFIVPMVAKEAAEYFLKSTFWRYPVLAGVYVSAAAYFTALYQAFILLTLIDKNEAFSDFSVKALKRIKYCAITISAVYAAGLPLFYIAAENDDAPGIIILGMIIIVASLVIAVFAAVLQKLLKNAIEIKAENDLTV